MPRPGLTVIFHRQATVTLFRFPSPQPPVPIPNSPSPGHPLPSPESPPPAFSAAWAHAWGEELNTNPAYREAGASWEGDLVLEMNGTKGGPARAVYLDLHRGTCRAARLASAVDLESAQYRFQASRDAWRRVLTGGVSPAVAIMTGQLKLARGSLMDFLPYADAATALLQAGGAIEAYFPED